MHVDLFDFDLPDENIALRPVSPRDSAKFLVVQDGQLQDLIVRSLPDLLQPGDALVFNDTRVIPTQLTGKRVRDGAEASVSATLHTRLTSNSWLCFIKGAKKIKVGDHLEFRSNPTSSLVLNCSVIAKHETGDIELEFEMAGGKFDEVLAQVGAMPLPPYIANKRAADGDDKDDYQTLYAKHDGAVAAPTAGLHFTDELFEALQARGISKHFVTLHVGPGTFLPVTVDDTIDHKMHSEWGVVTSETADALNRVHAAGGKIVCVGTTSMRLIETAATSSGHIAPWEGNTDIFITPGYKFKAVDVLMTSFHLPKSTLFMLVSAFCGLETMKAAYSYAIENGYRFYSYGDSSLLFRQDPDDEAKSG